MAIRLFKKKSSRPAYGWFGNYPTWQEAVRVSDGYDKHNILEKTKAALLKVKSGEAVYERDSVLFEKKMYPFPLITYLLHSAKQKRTPLNILDFGGSLGSTYFQIREFLSPDLCSGWNIVEQAHYIDCGRLFFEDEVLKFHYSIEDCLAHGPVDLAILSSVVQFLPEPHAFLEKLAAYGFRHIIFDRTFFVNGDCDRITVQNVWPSVYEASYPSWFFNEEGFLRHFQANYITGGEFSSYVPGESVLEIDREPVAYAKGFYLTKKDITDQPGLAS